MSDPYDPSDEFCECIDVPNDPDRDSVISAKARVSKLLDVRSSMGSFGSPMQQLGQKADDALRRSAEAERKAEYDPAAALEAADPHGLIDEEDRRRMLESRGYDPDEHL